jgi:hypothetical protein
MIQTKLTDFSLEKAKELYRNYLVSKGVGHSTIQTTLSDTFYLWKNEGKELFWKVVVLKYYIG